MQESASGGAVRVVIASRAAEAVVELEKLAGYADQVSLIGFVRYPSELDEDLEALHPDVVLLHPDFAGFDTADLVIALRSRAPSFGVVVAVDPDDAMLRLRVEEMGAATVSTGAPNADLVAALRDAAGRPEQALPEEAAQPATETLSPAGSPAADDDIGRTPEGEGATAEAEPAAEIPVFHLDTALRETEPPAPVPGAGAELVQPVRPRPPRRNSGRADLIVVFSGKGGVGKSLIATNLAVALAEAGDRVALVDLDLQFGDVSVMLHAESHQTAIDSLAPQGEQVEGEFIDEVMATGPSGVRALLAPQSPEFADLVNTANLRAILRELSKGYDHVVVDTPAHLEERNLEAIEMADQIVIVSSFSVTSIKDTKITLKLLQSLGIPKERLCVVLNQTRAKVSFPRAEVEENLRFRAVTVLPYEPRVDDCIDSGRPFITVEPKSEMARQLHVLFDHVMGRSGPAEPANPEPQQIRANRRRFSLGRG
jgi:MinD-like ATPase involved in chromosome partitioning or flagellar assembly/DNA-binding NarL/FixJ family response regulator